MNEKDLAEQLRLTPRERETLRKEWYEFKFRPFDDLIDMSAKAQLHKAFNTPIPKEGGRCYVCKGKWDWCALCGGTGKLPGKTFTIKEAIERMME